VIDLAGKVRTDSLGVLKTAIGAPGFILGFFGKGDALGLEDFGSSEDVVAPNAMD